jgi:tetratricopeptide (TPR) repeat protein
VIFKRKTYTRHAGIVLISLFFFFIMLGPAVSEETKKSVPGDIIIGLGAGYSIIQGQYAKSLSNSYRVGGSFMYGNSGIVKYLMGELEIAYARYPMKQSDRSFLQSASVSIGPVVCFPAATWLQLYTGASFRGSYLHLHTDKTDRNVKSIKPGFEAKAGFFFPVGRGFRLRVGADYTLEYLSGKPLHGVNVTGGLSFNFNPAEMTGGTVPGAGDPTERIDWYLSRADRALADGRTEEAKKHYASVLAIDRNNAAALEKVAAIKKAESDYSRAMKLSGEKRYLAALPLLADAGVYLDQARTEEKNIRKLIAGEIGPLEKQGISLYESGDYRGCIAVMKRLLLIDPKNRTGLIYLPRAQKRQEAMERLK